MNLDTAYDQFLTGTSDILDLSSGNLGLVEAVGWDFGEVASAATNDYYFDTPLLGGSTLTATLAWFRDRAIDPGNNVFDNSYDDLNLELWSVADGAPAFLISESSSLYNNTEHFSFALPSTGDYALRVRWFNELFDMIGDADHELYGLAWSAVAAMPGDFNHDGTVDAADYVIWRKTDGTQTGYDTWRANFGASLGPGSGSAAYPLGVSAESPSAAIPEPASLATLLCGIAMMYAWPPCHKPEA
jgi:hypothetical protein